MVSDGIATVSHSWIPAVVQGSATENPQLLLPDDYSLSAYPNPFNSTTTITFQVPRAEFVRLAVTDVQGRHAATLIEGNLNPGHHAIGWDAAGFASGTYIIHFNGGAGRATRKVMLIR
jgi:hypothetical protein